MNKVVFLPLQDTAVGFYRMVQPARFMARQKLVKDVKCYPFSGENESQNFKYSDEYWMTLCKDADVVYSTLASREMLIKLLNLRKRWGFKLFFDIDDNLYSVPEDNPGAKIAKNLKGSFEDCMSMCDGLTVSVPNLKKVYSHLNDNIFVTPNFIDPKLYNFPKKKHRGIRIGWRGAWGHKQDADMIRLVIDEIKKNYKVTFVTFGYKPDWSDEHHEWIGLFDFPEKLASFKLDMALIPLIDSAYNRCKSNLAYLEYSALGIPTITSPTENQKGCGINCKSNFEWYQAIEKIIKEKPTVAFVDTNKTKALYQWMKESKRRNF